MQNKMLFLLVFVVFASGCATAPPEPITLDSEFYQKPAKVAIYKKPFEENARMTMPGASCLLCMAAAAVANSDVSAHTKTLSTEELLTAVKRMELAFEEQGMDVEWVDIEDPMKRLPRFKAPSESGYPKKDYRALKQVIDADHLLVVDFSHIGIERLYSNYVPTSSPQGAVTGDLYMVDLNTNQYYLLEPVHIRVPVEGEWDEPPEFPGLTMAYFEALERAKMQISEALVGKDLDEVAGDSL